MNRERLELCGEIAVVAGVILVPALAWIAVRFEIVRQPTSVAVLSVQGMCCEQRGESVVRALKQTVGVADAAPNYFQSVVKLELAESHTSARAIWDALAPTKVQPIELQIGGSSFRQRPLE